LPVDVYSSASDMEYILESMMTISDVQVSIVEHTLETAGPLSSYGRTWSVTFFDSHYQSLLVDTGYGKGIISSGGYLKGFNAMVYVERTKFESLPTSYTISGLTSSQRYVARVRGYNGDFWNSPVTSAIAVAPQLSAASIPLNVRTSLLSETQILVFWNSPEDNGGSPISGYLVEWDVDSSFSENANSFLVTSKMYYEISRLVSNSTYYIRVSAYNTQGYSPFAIAESVTQWADIQVIDVESNAL